MRVAERPVDVLARAVDAGERLLVQQARHAVLLGHALERHHHQLLMVGGEVGALEHRRDLELAGRDLVVPGLDRDAELEQLALGVQHEGEHALGDGAEVVVLELLALGRLGAEQRAAGVEQVGPGEEEVPVDQEVLLLGAGSRRRPWPTFVWPNSFRMRCGLRRSAPACERSSGVFLSSASPVQRDERRRDAERRAVGVLQDVGRAGDVPDGVAAGLERVAHAAGGEARGVRLALDQRLAGELGERRPSPSGARKLSCFSAVRPVSG